MSSAAVPDNTVSGDTVSGDTVPAEAVVLVGGKGTRMRPLTLSTPKPMLPLAGVPFLTHLFRRIADAGIGRIVVSTSYLAEEFERHFGDGSALGVELVYVTEAEPLDTAGAIRNVYGELRGENVLVFNGDVLSGTDPRVLLEHHRERGADVTLHLVKVDDPSRFGCVPTDADGRVTAFLEKTPNPPTDQINAGCYVFRREVIEAIPTGRRVSVERETFPGLLDSGAHVAAYVDSAYWLDVGTPEAFVRGSADLVRGIAPSPALPEPAGEAMVLADAEVAEDAELCGGSVVGVGAVIGAGARCVSSVLLAGATVAAGATVERSVLGVGAAVGAGAVVTDAVIGDRAIVGANCELRHGARVWPDVVLPDGGLRFSADA